MRMRRTRSNPQQTAFAYDVAAKTCQLMEKPGASTFGYRKNDPSAGDYAPVYFTGERAGPGGYSFCAKE